MIVEQLAGDELAPTDTDTLRATGFLARNYYLFNRTTWLDDVIEHTSKAFLGLTLNCAKCHDHKYDPLTQIDYYAWRAIFEPYHARLDEWHVKRAPVVRHDPVEARDVGGQHRQHRLLVRQVRQEVLPHPEGQRLARRDRLVRAQPRDHDVRARAAGQPSICLRFSTPGLHIGSSG